MAIELDAALPERERIADQVYGALRQRIFARHLQPGSRLSVPSIAAQFGVSRSPVREAVQRLVQDGLATEEPHRGAAVTRLTVDELNPLYEFREVLEGYAARLAAVRATRGHLADLGAALADHADGIEQGDVAAHIAADTRFHAIIRDAARDAELSVALERVQGKVVIAMVSGDVQHWPKRALEEHRWILDALVLGDSERAEKVARQHIDRIRQDLVNLQQPSHGIGGRQSSEHDPSGIHREER